ncbi:MAG: NADH-quinone oxidoreductase subunit N [Phycisphaeraceae bacterium]|nr:NADH-quinone oxidoreductase subunit N [Phycisphaeraceae bacterium]
MITKLEFIEAMALIKESVGYFGPEAVLSIAVIVLLLHDLFTKGARPERAAWVASGFLAVAGLLLWRQTGVHDPDHIPAGSSEIFGWLVTSDAGEVGHKGMLAIDGFGKFFKVFVLLGTLVTIPMCLAHPAFKNRRMGEFYALLVAATLGMFLMASATNLLMVYMGIEFASMASYLAVAFVKRDRRGSEAGLKYVVYGSVASGVMIYGLSLIYGMTGSLHMSDLAEFSVVSAESSSLFVASVLIFAGFAYKMASFPMHFWCPDVYEGAPVPFTAYLSVTSKAAGFAVFIRFLMAMGDVTVGGDDGGYVASFGWQGLIGGAAAFSMTAGNVAALWQTNLKRMLAYSSIAQAGYLLMGVAVLTPDGGAEQYGPILFYFIAYFFMNLGAFFVVTLVAAKTGSEDLDGYRGLITRAPALTILLGLCLISLLGLPPTGGFIGKLQLFQMAISGGMLWLAVVGGINTAISAYYYFRIIKVATLDEAEDARPLAFDWSFMTLVAILAVPILVLGVAFNPVVEFTRQFGL